MSGSLFDIVGPVMVGPSSSHTAGAVRLGLLAKMLANQPVVRVKFYLYNSFAQTYKGHGTDKGLLGGLLGFGVDDERIRETFQHADDSGLIYEFIPEEKPNNTFSPNTVLFELTLKDSQIMTVIGHSTGGGRVYVSKFNAYSVNLKGEAPTVILFYKDQPGMIWKTTKIIADAGINIANLNCSRLQRNVEAFMAITLDEPLPADTVQEIYNIPDVHMARCLEQLPQ